MTNEIKNNESAQNEEEIPRRTVEDYDPDSTERRSRETAPARAKRYLNVMRSISDEKERPMTEAEWNGA